jgi:hypothetical protein
MKEGVLKKRKSLVHQMFQLVVRIQKDIAWHSSREVTGFGSFIEINHDERHVNACINSYSKVSESLTVKFQLVLCV